MASSPASGTFVLPVQYGDESAILTLPAHTSFALLHLLLQEHWPQSRAGETFVVDGDGMTFPEEEIVGEWVSQLPDGVVYLVTDPHSTTNSRAPSRAVSTAPSPSPRSFAHAVPGSPNSRGAQSGPPEERIAEHGTDSGAEEESSGVGFRSPTSSLLQYVPNNLSINSALSPAAPVPAPRAASQSARAAAPSSAARAHTRAGSQGQQQRVGRLGSKVLVAPHSVRGPSFAAPSSEKRPRRIASASPVSSSPIASPDPVAPSSTSFPGVSIEAALWRVFSHYSMAGSAFGCPDALSSQLFWKMMHDCKLANKAITRGGVTSGSGQQRTGGVGELIEQAAADGASPPAPSASPPALHGPPPPCTPLRRSDVELIYSKALKTLPSCALTNPPPPSTPAPATPSTPLPLSSPSASPPPSAIALASAAPTKMSFELFVHSLLSVAQEFYAVRTGAGASAQAKKVAFHFGPNASAGWDTDLQAGLLKRLVVEYILPRADRWDAREPKAFRELLRNDAELEAVVRHFDGPMVLLFKRYANASEAGMRAANGEGVAKGGWDVSTTTTATNGGLSSPTRGGAQQQAPLSPSSATSPSSPASSSTGNGNNAVTMSWAQWQSLCCDFHFSRMLLTPQDTSKLFVQAVAGRVAAEAKASGSSAAFYQNPARLGLTQFEFLQVIPRAAITAMSKMHLHVGPAWMVKAFIGHMQSASNAPNTAALGRNACALSGSGSTSAVGKGSLGAAAGGSAALNRGYSSSSQDAVLQQAIAKLREAYVAMWRADASINYYDAGAVHSRVESLRAKARQTMRDAQVASAAAAASGQATEGESKQNDQSIHSRSSSDTALVLSSHSSSSSSVVSKQTLPPYTGPSSAAEWVSALPSDRAFQRLCREVAAWHDPHRLVLEPLVGGGPGVEDASVEGGAAASAGGRARTKVPAIAASSPGPKQLPRPPSASPPGKSAASASPPASSPSASATASSATDPNFAKTDFDHLMLFPRRRGAAAANLAPPAPAVSLTEKRAQASIAARVKDEQRKRAEHARQASASLVAERTREQGPPPSAAPFKQADNATGKRVNALLDAFALSVVGVTAKEATTVPRPGSRRAKATEEQRQRAAAEATAILAAQSVAAKTPAPAAVSAAEAKSAAHTRAASAAEHKSPSLSRPPRTPSPSPAAVVQRRSPSPTLARSTERPATPKSPAAPKAATASRGVTPERRSATLEGRKGATPVPVQARAVTPDKRKVATPTPEQPRAVTPARSATPEQRKAPSGRASPMLHTAQRAASRAASPAPVAVVAGRVPSPVASAASSKRASPVPAAARAESPKVSEPAVVAKIPSRPASPARSSANAQHPPSPRSSPSPPPLLHQRPPSPLVAARSSVGSGGLTPKGASRPATPVKALTARVSRPVTPVVVAAAPSASATASRRSRPQTPTDSTGSLDGKDAAAAAAVSPVRVSSPLSIGSDSPKSGDRAAAEVPNSPVRKRSISAPRRSPTPDASFLSMDDASLALAGGAAGGAGGDTFDSMFDTMGEDDSMADLLSSPPYKNAAPARDKTPARSASPASAVSKRPASPARAAAPAVASAVAAPAKPAVAFVAAASSGPAPYANDLDALLAGFSEGSGSMHTTAQDASLRSNTTLEAVDENESLVFGQTPAKAAPPGAGPFNGSSTVAAGGPPAMSPGLSLNASPISLSGMDETFPMPSPLQQMASSSAQRRIVTHEGAGVAPAAAAAHDESTPHDDDFPALAANSGPAAAPPATGEGLAPLDESLPPLRVQGGRVRGTPNKASVAAAAARDDDEDYDLDLTEDGVNESSLLKTSQQRSRTPSLSSKLSAKATPVVAAVAAASTPVRAPTVASVLAAAATPQKAATADESDDPDRSDSATPPVSPSARLAAIEAKARVAQAAADARRVAEERAAEEAQWQALVRRAQEGEFMTKYTPGVFGAKSERKFVQVSQDGTKLCWGANPRFLLKSITLADVREVRVGVAGSKAMGKLKGADAACALAIVTKGRTLELVAPDQESRDAWISFVSEFLPEA